MPTRLFCPAQHKSSPVVGAAKTRTWAERCGSIRACCLLHLMESGERPFTLGERERPKTRPKETTTIDASLLGQGVSTPWGAPRPEALIVRRSRTGGSAVGAAPLAMASAPACCTTSLVCSLAALSPAPAPAPASVSSARWHISRLPASAPSPSAAVQTTVLWKPACRAFLSRRWPMMTRALSRASPLAHGRSK